MKKGYSMVLALGILFFSIFPLYYPINAEHSDRIILFNHGMG